MIHSNVHAFQWNANTQNLEVIDQLALPDIERFVPHKTVADVADAITGMLVRGAPAIGIVAAYGIYYSARKYWDEPNKLELIQRDKNTLAETRPTAVNLFWALERMMHCVNAHIADKRFCTHHQSGAALYDDAQPLCRRVSGIR